MSNLQGLKNRSIQALTCASFLIFLLTWNTVSTLALCPCLTPRFSQPSYFAAGTTQNQIVTGDINGDNNPDLVVANRGSNTVSVLYGDGFGGFPTSTDTPVCKTANDPCTNYMPFSVGVGDFDGDDDIDAVTANFGANEVSVLLNNGSTGLQRPTASEIYAINTPTKSLAVGDYGNDGDLDVIVAANFPSVGGIAVLLNNGSGVFSLQTPIGTVSNPDFVLTADFDNDGYPDVAATDPDLVSPHTTDMVSILMANPSGGFFTRVDINVGLKPMSLATSDLNNDGDADLVVVNRNSSFLSVLLGDGAGGFTTSQVSVSTGPYAVAPGDFNNDGNIDLALGNHSASTMTILLGDGTGAFPTAATTYPIVNTAFPFSVVADDFNKDNKTDLGIGNHGGTNATVFINTCNVALSNDYERDGKTDIAVWRQSNGYWYLSNSSSGSLTSVQFGTTSDQPVPGDYDGDAKTDLAVFRPSNTTWYILNSSTNTTSSVSWGLSSDKLVPGDYDGDGKTDVAVFRQSNSTWYILQSSNGSTVTQSFGSSSDKPAQADYDGDGKVDIAVFRPSNTYWYILQSSNNSTVSHQWGNGTDVPVPGDYDSDGKSDVATFRPSTGAWYARKSSDGSLQSYSFGSNGDQPQPGDYDGDGITDVAVFRPSTNYWYVLKSSDSSVITLAWGTTGDVPVSAEYIIQ